MTNEALDVNVKGLSVKDDGSLDVNLQDQVSTPIDFFFVKANGAPTTLAIDAAIDDSTLTLTSAAGCSDGDYFGMFNSDDPENNRAYFGSIIGAPVGNVITLDTPLDFAFQAGDTAACFSRNLNVDGDTTPQIYQVQVGANSTQSIDITRLIVSFITADVVDLVKFADQPALAKGCVFRRVDGMTNNIFNVKTNGEIANICYDYQPFAASKPNEGQDGAKFRISFAGQEKHGVAIRLAPGDSLQCIIQDDLTGITDFRIVAQGHYVVNGP